MQQANVEKNLYKGLGEENSKLKARIVDMEKESNTLLLKIQTLESQLQEYT